MFSGLSVVQPSTRRWTALTSFTLQAAVIASVLVFPMLYPQHLPPMFFNRRIFVPTPNGEVQTVTTAADTHSSGISMAHPIVVSRDWRGPRLNSMAPADNAPSAPDIVIGDPRSAFTILMSGPSNPVLPRMSVSKPLKTSVVMEGNLIHRIEPRYPIIARQIRLEGAVVLNAIISREGNIERIEVASGPPLLAAAAEDAVRQWKYRPYYLNGEPTEVETQITVNFLLNR